MPLSDEANFHFSTVLIAALSKSSCLLEVKMPMLKALPLGSTSNMTSTRPSRPCFLAALGYSGLPQLIQVPGAGPEGREGLPPLPGFVGFGIGPEPLPNGSDERPPPFPPPPDDEFDPLPTGLPPTGLPPPGLPEEPRFPTPGLPFPELPPPPGLVLVTGEPAGDDPPNRPEPAPNGSEEGMSPFSLAPPDGEFDPLPTGLPPPGPPEEARFPTPGLPFPELPLPPGLVAVTGDPAPGDRFMGPEEGFNGSEEGSPLPAEADGESGLFFSGLSEDLGFPASFVKSVELPAPLGREAVTGGSLGGDCWGAVVLGLSIFGGSGEGFLGSLAIGVLGVSGGLKSCLGAIGEGSTGVGGEVSGSGFSLSCGGVAATGGTSGIGGGVDRKSVV